MFDVIQNGHHWIQKCPHTVVKHKADSRYVELVCSAKTEMKQQ